MPRRLQLECPIISHQLPSYPNVTWPLSLIKEAAKVVVHPRPGASLLLGSNLLVWWLEAMWCRLP